VTFLCLLDNSQSSKKYNKYQFLCIRLYLLMIGLDTSETCRRVNVRCTLIHAQRLSTGRMGHRGSRGIALLFLDHGTRKGWGVSVTPQPHFNSGKDPVPIVQEAGWAPGPVWTGAENLVPPPGIDPRTFDYATRECFVHQAGFPLHGLQVASSVAHFSICEHAVRK